MKSILSGLLTGGVLLIATGFLTAQENDIALNNKHVTHSTSTQSPIGSQEKISEKKVNIRAVRDFVKQFNSTDSATWYKVRDGYIVTYTQNGNHLRTGYAFNGNWLYNLVSYTEDKMPRDVWHLVKSTFYDFSITLVNEIEQGSAKIYIVHLQNKFFFQNVRVCDGELDIIQKLVIEPLPK